MNPLPLAWKSLKRRPLRNWLTILGVVIGIASIVGLINVGQGLQSSITAVVEDSNANYIFIIPKTFGAPGTNPSLTQKDYDVIDSFSEFSEVTGAMVKIVPVEYGGERVLTYIQAAENLDQYYPNFGVEIEQGRYPTDRDKKSAVIGPMVNDLFDKEIFVGSQIKINDEKYRVVGVHESLGNPQDDTVISVPYNQAENLFGIKDRYSMIAADVKPGLDVEKVKDKLYDRLVDVRGNEEIDVSTQEDLLEAFGDILNIVNFIVIGVAGISLLVGSVGILNSMYTSVLERTKDIGIMKSVGATNNQIMLVFMAEAALVGFIGGVVGTLIGFGIGAGVDAISEAAGWGFINVKPTLDLAIFGLVFGTAFGAVSGFWPARNASQLQPVESLGYD